MTDTRYPHALAAGSLVGGYRIEQVLGAGGFGMTYRAAAPDGRTVAIKEFFVRDMASRVGQDVITRSDEGADEDYAFALGKFRDEAEAILHRFHHPNIIRGEALIEANNTSYLVMDFVDGVTLEDFLLARREAPREAELRLIFEPILDAVAYVHDGNMMHRDLTPRNIMLRRDGTPVLIDFGAAGQGIGRDRVSRMVAQMRYAPPEQTQDDAVAVHGRFTDIFSLGGVLYRAVTTRPPMPPMTRVVRMGRADDGGDPQLPAARATPAPENYTARFLKGIDQALQIDERRRPQSIAEFKSALGWSSAPGREETPLRFDPQEVSSSARQRGIHRRLNLPADLGGTIVLPRSGAPETEPTTTEFLDRPGSGAWLWGGVAAAVLIGAGTVAWPWLRDTVLLPPAVASDEPAIAARLNDAGRQAERGIGRAASGAEAIRLYEEAIAAGSRQARYNLAVMLDAGRPTPEETERAARLLVEAAMARQPAALDALLGDMTGFSADLRRAVKRRLKAGAAGLDAVTPVWDDAARKAGLSLLQ